MSNPISAEGEEGKGKFWRKFSFFGFLPLPFRNQSQTPEQSMGPDHISVYRCYLPSRRESVSNGQFQIMLFFDGEAYV